MSVLIVPLEPDDDGDQAADELHDECVICGAQLGEHAYEVDVTSKLGTVWVDPVCWQCMRALKIQAQIDGEYTTVRRIER